MFSSIVVGCDGSAQSLQAIELAQQLREPDGGRLTLVSVFPLHRGFAAPVTPVLYAEWLRDQAQQILDTSARGVAAGVPYETRTFAAPSSAGGLNDVAEDVGADLLVLGPSHHHAGGRMFGRTTVQRLLHGAPCAIAVAAPDQAERTTGTIAVAYDGSEEAIVARDTAYAIAAARHLPVRLCAAIEPMVFASGFAPPIEDTDLDEGRERSANAGLAEAAATAPPDIVVDFAVGHGPQAAMIEQLVGDDPALIVAGSRGYGTLRRAIAGSTSGTLLTNGRHPVLVTPRPKDTP